MRPHEYIFIDGAYLRRVVERISQEYCDGSKIPVDYGALFFRYEKKFYYDCPPPRRENESDDDYERRREAFDINMERMQAERGFHVFLGTTAGIGGKARQKGVDIQISVHMLTHCFRRNVKHMTLLAGDRDFEPLVDALVQDGAYVNLRYHRSSISKELLRAADMGEPLTTLEVIQNSGEEFRGLFPVPEVGLTSAFPLPSGGREVTSCKTKQHGLATLYDEGPTYVAVVEWKERGAPAYLYVRDNSPDHIKWVLFERDVDVTW